MNEEQKNKKEVLASWTTPEFIHYEKSPGWFIVFILIAAAFLIAALLMKNYIFGLLVLLASFLIYTQALKKPPEIKITISQEGVFIQNALYAYKDLKSFWLFENPEIMALSLESKKILSPHISIPLARQSPEKIRQFLIQFIPEKKQEESVIDSITRHLKF